jgi:2-oxoisovalerate dehydrogenase E1 component alpha subunit
MFGDGATSKGDVYEAMNFAGVHKLPVVFVATNNQWAISVPLRLQTGCETLAQKAIAAGFAGEQIDGCDAAAVRAAAEEAIAAARDGKGPRFIEAVTTGSVIIQLPMMHHAIARLTKYKLIGRKSRLRA